MLQKNVFVKLSFNCRSLLHTTSSPVTRGFMHDLRLNRQSCYFIWHLRLHLSNLADALIQSNLVSAFFLKYLDETQPHITHVNLL